MQRKRCGHCKKQKPIDQFGKETARPDGLKSSCKICQRKLQRRAYTKNRKKRIAATKKWTAEHYDYVLSYQKTRRAELRAKVIEGYGGKCTCCGETISEFLTIEHPAKDGKAHRKQCKSGSDGVYRDIIRRGFPDCYTLLCCNCNYAERYGQQCPHKRLAEGKEV